MSFDALNDFDRILLCDTEYVARAGEPVVPVALSALELRSGQQWQLFFDAPYTKYANPLPFDDNTLFVAHAAHAEFSTFLSLGWALPEWILDTYAESRAATNGMRNPDGSPYSCGIIEMLALYGLDSMTVVEKQEMRDLILRGRPYTPDERRAILDYNMQDVRALETLLPALLPTLDLPAALHRGRYMKAVARMEHTGIPIDGATYERLQNGWESLKSEIAGDVEHQYGYGVYDIGKDNVAHWRQDGFASLLNRMGIDRSWPRTPSGSFSTDNDEVFTPMCRLYPELEPLRQVRTTLNGFRAFNLAVGKDYRNRASLMPFGTVTARNAPKASRFAFGPSTWIRALIQPEPGCALAYIDFSSAEFGEAAALSGDANMITAYHSGDVYLATAKLAGMAPPDATKKSHRETRDLFKVVVLATQYGQTAGGLARAIGKPLWKAQELLDHHRRAYKRFWRWSDYVVQRARFSRTIETELGWPLRITSRTKENTIKNFPMQGNGSEILRWSCIYACERGIEVCCPVHDALLIHAPAEQIDEAVAITQDSMREASRLVLGGFELRTDAKIFCRPRFPHSQQPSNTQQPMLLDRYYDERGAEMWDRVMRLLCKIEGSPFVNSPNENTATRLATS